jgi:uncharacterized protein YrrD
MSSSGEGERFTIGAHVEAADGRCGRLSTVIVDPADESLTHLVVEPGHHEHRARLVPVDLVASVEAELILLSCTKQQFDQLDAAEDVTFSPDPPPAVYIGGRRRPGHDREPLYSDRVPPGEVEIRPGRPVHAKDGWIGAVKGVVIDPVDDQVTHVILQEGHVWGHKQVAIPIETADLAGDEIRVDLTKDEIEALPPVSVSPRR